MILPVPYFSYTSLSSVGELLDQVNAFRAGTLIANRGESSTKPEEMVQLGSSFFGSDQATKEPRRSIPHFIQPLPHYVASVMSSCLTMTKDR
jgi:hypothetical protein